MGKWITTKTGRHIYIDDKGKSFSKGPKDYNYYKSKELKLPKEEYGEIASLIDSHPKKWKKGINYQDINNNIYGFYYKCYNEFVIISSKKRGDKYE
jgi:hypothetical protein|nr:MAG TPA: hypothetical protein [Caudoviricetes sp.]